MSDVLNEIINYILATVYVYYQTKWIYKKNWLLNKSFSWFAFLLSNQYLRCW